MFDSTDLGKLFNRSQLKASTIFNAFSFGPLSCNWNLNLYFKIHFYSKLSTDPRFESVSS